MTSTLTGPPIQAQNKPLDPSQKSAAEAPEGPVVITGGPGTGKTHTLVRRVAALLRGQAKPATITYLTYTRKSADIAREHIAALIPDQEVTKKLFVGTFHAYASTYLRQAGSAKVDRTPHYSLWDRDQSVEVVTSIMEDHPGELNLGTKEIGNFLGWMGKNKARWGNEPISPDHAFWLILEKLYEDEKIRQNTMDLDDVVVMAIRAMEADPRSRSIWNSIRSRHILVDEFQDITPTQYHLLELMQGPTRSITIASDPNQCIYAWRGADNTLVERFHLDHPRASTHHLKMNHRSTSTLVETALLVSSSDASKGLKPDAQTPSRPPGSQPRIIDCSGNMHDLITIVVAEAVRLNAGGMEWHDMAMIAKTKDPANHLELALRAQSIPNHVIGATRSSNQDSLKRLMALLACLINPMDLGNFRSAACTEPGETKRGLNAQTAKRINNISYETSLHLIHAAEQHIDDLKPGARSRHGLEYIIPAWHRLNDLLEENLLTMKEFMERALAEVQRGTTKTLHSHTTPGVSDPIAQIMALSESSTKLNRESLRDHLTRFLETAKGVNYPDLAEDDAEDPFDPQAGIALSTIHKAKGQQWQAVWLIDASEHIIPGKWAEEQSSTMDDGHRLFYVAVTRATDILYICNAAQTTESNDPDATLTRFAEAFENVADYSTQPT